MRRLMVLLVLVLAGCGTDTTADVGHDDVAEAATDFARCMREHGIEVSDPTFGEDGLPRFEQQPGAVRAAEGADFEEVRRTCAEPLNEAMAAAGIEANKPDDTSTLLPFARCMREQGIEFPDPVSGEPLEIPKSALDGPTWEPAAQACEDTVPEEWREILEAPGGQGEK
ncbi:MAG: hypothetical protein LC635_00425 [Pseudonocardiaceae bacterium]|nr:hypothetical protein [Pseudonocardiaceae bacterium]